MSLSVPLLDLQAEYRSIRADVDAAIARVVEAQRFVLGPEVEELEAEIAELVGVPHAIGCASGTDALLLPLRALGALEDAEVIVPAFTFFATAGAVWNAGLRPVFCDVDPRSYNVTPESVDSVWSERTRAVVVVHLYGQPAPVEEIIDLARSRGAAVIEDVAQSIGAARETRDGREVKAGAAGLCGAFSFFPTKNLGGFGDGGLVTTADADLAERVRKLRVHGGRQMYHHEYVGTNSRLDAIQAAVLRAKLPHLARWTELRRENAARYDERLADLPEVRVPWRDPASRHVFNQYTVRAEARDRLRAHLSGQGIATGLYYPVPLHLQPCFASLGGARGDLPVSEAACEDVLSLPVFPTLGEEGVDRVHAAIRSFYRG